ncbi:MAG: phosphomannomutase/phosphoglucomutase [Methylococcaceae bacterium]|nr:phosphomannomutase/phosphoglucomutase [Methylococcaceae bacterium]
MKRIFTILTAVAVLMILSVGSSVCWLSSTQIEQSKQQAMQATAAGIAATLSGRIALLQQLVATLAQSPPVIAAFNSADPLKLEQTATQLEQYIPGAIKIRLVLPETPNQTVTAPAMGFADQEMVRESFTNQQLPAVHEQGNNQHLAIAAKTTQNNTTIGVLLASITVTPINQSIQTATINDGYMRLMQGKLPLQEHGESTLKDAATQQINVDNSNWRIEYASAPALDSTLKSLFAALIVAAALLAVLLCFQAYRYFENLFVRDRGVVIAATKDLLSNRLQENYPVKFSEMHFMIESITAFDRTLKKSLQPQAETAPYHFSEESEGFNFSISTAITIPSETSESHEHKNDDEGQSAVNLFPVAQDTLDTLFKGITIRGIVDKHLTKALVYDIGRAYGSELLSQQIKKIILGHDARHSSPAFAEAFAKGVIATGLNVLDIGQVPIPLLYFVALQTEGASGVMITGGHSTGQVNGLKFLINGEPSNEKQLAALKKRMGTENYTLNASGSIERNNRYSNDYLNKITKDIQLINPLKVVLDCGNGVTSLIAPKLLKALGCEVIELFCEINGDFPNHFPDPSKSENMSDLMAAVHHYQADIGIAFNGDGDRLGLVDSAGKLIAPDRQILLFAKNILQTKPGADIIYDEKCSPQITEQITQYGGRPLVCKGGQALLRAKLKETSAAFAGEMNGRMMFNDRWSGLDDALYAAARLLEILSADVRDSAAIFSALSNPARKPALSTEFQDG